MYSVTLGTFVLVFILIIITLIVRHLSSYDMSAAELNRSDYYYFFGLLLRIVWMVIVILMENMGYKFFVNDDETYYKYAMHIINAAPFGTELGGYHYFLRAIYDIFGKSSLNGRLINMFASLAAIYPLSYIERRLVSENNFIAVRLMALSPYMIMVSFFEIKDIILLFAFTSGYAMVKFLEERIHIGVLMLLLCDCMVIESFRSGMGALLVGVLAISVIIIFQKNSNGNRFLNRILITCTVVIIGICVYIVASEYIGELFTSLTNYQSWIFTQFSEDSFYNWLVITKLSDIWKVPICFVFYLFLPTSALAGTGRFFSDFGLFARFIELPMLLISLVWIPRYVKKEKFNSLLFLTPYVFLSAVNLTNARESLFIYPIFYLIYSYGYDGIVLYGKTTVLKLFSWNEMNHYAYLALFYFMWFLVCIYRIG